MANCHNCERLVICPWANPEEIICSSFKAKPITNGDRIRSMTDEELADWVWGAETAGRAYGPRGKKAWLDWLKQEATDGAP